MIGGFGVGIPIMLFGIFFLSFGLARVERRGLWAAIVGFGAVPVGLLYNSGSDATLAVLLFGAVVIMGAIWGLLEAVGLRKASN